VDHVNGAAIDPPQTIWLDNLSLPTNTRCAVSGYESGRWIGLTDEVGAAEGLPLRQGVWQFHRCFIVTSVQEPPSLAAQLSHASN